jgi:predicted permease
MFEALVSDVHYALKWLVRSPGFAAIAIASLAVGIGFNTTIFSLVDALLLRPLPVERPDRLVDVYTRGGDGDTYSTNSYPDLLDFKARNSVFSDMIGYSPSIAAIKAGERGRMALGEVVTGNYFQMLGVRSVVGRTLLPDDDKPGAQRAVAISHGMWTREYGADPAIVGKTMTIRGQTYTIVGVVSPEYRGMMPVLQPDIWTPFAWVEELEPAGIQETVPGPGDTRLERRGQRWLFAKGRLKDGQSLEQAEANVKLIMQQLAAEYPKTNSDRPIAVAAGVRVHPQADKVLQPVALGLMVGIGLVLLVACANVANMLLARASGRRREIGVRLAIGASRGRLIRQLLTESLVVSTLGGIAGIGLAAWMMRMVASVPLPLPVKVGLSIDVDTRVLLFTLVVATLAGVVAGLAPALRATRPNLVSDLKGDVSSSRTAGRRWSLRDGLVVLQTAVTLVLLVSAALLTRSLLAANEVNLGFRPDGVAVISSELGLIGYDDARAQQFYDRLFERIKGLPGVQSAARTVRQPLAINYNRHDVYFPDRQRPGDRGNPIAATWVDENYFATLNVPLLRGRNVTSADTRQGPRVAVVTESFVRTYWPGAEPLGRRFRIRGLDGPEIEVVGVVADYKVNTIGEQPTPYIHYPSTQRSFFTGEVMIARTSGDARVLLETMKREVLAMEPNAILFEAETLDSLVDLTLLPARLAAQTIGLVGLVATVLAAIGLYGVIAYSVARRTREIGIRMALGAAPTSVMGMVMRQGLTVACIGLATGAVLAWIAARAIASGLYGVSATDPAAWAGAATVLLIAAALANYVPARRAARVDPSIALRLE